MTHGHENVRAMDNKPDATIAMKTDVLIATVAASTLDALLVIVLPRPSNERRWVRVGGVRAVCWPAVQTPDGGDDFLCGWEREEALSRRNS